MDEKLLPCPFCGSIDLRVSDSFCDDDGEHLGVECMSCDGMNRLKFWNNRASISQYQNPSCFGKKLGVEACNHGCPVSDECYRQPD